MGAEQSHTDLETDTPVSQGKAGVGLSGRWSAPPEGIKVGFPEEEVSE